MTRKGSREKVFVLLAPGFSEVEVSTITSTLRHSGLPVKLIGLTAGPVCSAYGLSVVPDLVLSDIALDQPMAIILPGGPRVVRHLTSEPRVRALVQRTLCHGGCIAALDQAYVNLYQANLPNHEEIETLPTGWDADGLLDERIVVDGSVIVGQDSTTAQKIAEVLQVLIDKSECDPQHKSLPLQL